MRYAIKRFGLGLLALMLWPSVGGLWAEVPFANTYLSKRVALEITEGPDPIPQVAWTFELDLDPSGDAYRDGRPDIVYESETGWPRVVWSYDNGADHDVAYAAWNGSEWEQVYLGATPADEVDPKIHVTDIGVFVLWRDPVLDLMWLVTKSPGGEWSEAESVNLEGADWRSSLVSWQSQLLLTFERPADVAGQEVVLLTRFGPGLYTTQVVATSEETAAMEPALHAEGDQVWLDWRQSAGTYGFVVLGEGEWGDVETVIWDANNLLEARQFIRSHVLVGPPGD